MGFNRREVLKGGLAALSMGVFDGLSVFAASPDWKPSKKPNLAFGILTDTHYRVEWNGVSLWRGMSLDYVRNAFKLFRERKIDAFLHLGDGAHRAADREIEFHRELFEEVFGKRGGPDWIMPLNWGTVNGERGTATHPFSRDELVKTIGAPEFGKKAKLEVGKASDGVKLKIPLADGNPGSRAYAYDVVVIGDDPTKKVFKSVYFEGCNLGIGHEPDHGITSLDIPKDELPEGKKLTIAVRPLSSLGTKGGLLVVTYSAATGSISPRKV